MTQARQDLVLDNPWERHGWILAAIWLVFLAFPALGVVEETQGRPVLRALHLGLLLGFAVVYLWAFIRGQEAQGCGWTRRDHVVVIGGFVLMGVIACIVGTLIGAEIIGAGAFMAALAAWGFPTARQGLIGVTATLVACAGLLVATGELTDLWPLLVIPALVGSFSQLMRVLTDGDVKRELLQRDLAVTSERDRVARDVHDVLGHSLTVISLKADLAERLIPVDPDRAREEVRQIQSLTRQSLAEIRATVAGLRIARLAEELDTAAAALRDAGIKARLPDDPDVVDPGLRITVAWALREAVTNVVRHSGARRVEVSWGPTWLDVADDGRGRRGRREGSGLTGLRERVALAGGRIELAHGLAGGDGPGTRVRVVLGSQAPGSPTTTEGTTSPPPTTARTPAPTGTGALPASRQR
ncbi:hypothetical protein ASJ30_05935 [Janibacter indicus]|uniref:Signal transduction histidine kinase subgroup 3 dimerisation and phosphoacceptor domain-containing protein n=1 Tax=Janibacter indicus TaxID=857417 RepID=A0A1L3MG11_9MICO|nr:histidine kinase [Janibacter indicus]APH01136.1 hypothetical protein ASJ30_05935 [Janibacter indicus]